MLTKLNLFRMTAISKSTSSYSGNAHQIASVHGEQTVSKSASSHLGKDFENVQSVENEQKSTEPVQKLEEMTKEVPVHLQEVFKSSVDHLDSQQKEQLATLLCNYADVFATDDFDLGNFIAIEYSIDTMDAKPVKQHMRRTPACFNEEEADL